MAIRAFVGASEVAAMLGSDRRKSPLSLFHLIRGDVDEPGDNELFEEGREFEDAIARIAARKAGFEIVDPVQVLGEVAKDSRGVVLRSGPLSAHPDRLARLQDGTYANVEVKNTLFGGVAGEWGEPGTDQVPKPAWLQSQTYQGVLREVAPGVKWADRGLVPARLSHGVQIFEVPFDPEIYTLIKSTATAFLSRCERNDPPTPRDEQDMRDRWLVTDAKSTVIGTPAILQMAKDLAKIKAGIKSAEKAASDIRAALLAFAKEAAAITDETGQVKVRLGANRVFDPVAFTLRHPDLAAKFQRLDTTAVQKAHRAIYEACKRMPADTQEQVRTIKWVDGDSDE